MEEFKFEGITTRNDWRFEDLSGWTWCGCIRCGVGYQKYRPTTAGGYCLKCKEETELYYKGRSKNLNS